MIDQLELLKQIETYVGALFVVFYGFERFRKTPSEPGARRMAYPSRATTTAASYYTGVLLYSGIGLVVYAGILLCPSLVSKMSALSGELGVAIPGSLRQSPSVLVALFLTVLLPRVPILAGLDDFVRTQLQHMAAIPYEVRRLAAELRRATFRAADDHELAEITPALLARGFGKADVRYATGDSLLARWMRLTTLMRRLEVWEAEGGLKDYVLECPGELDALRERHEELGAKLRRACELARTTEAEPDGRAAATLAAYREEVASALDAELRDLHDAISRAVLLGEYTQPRRVRRLHALGFQVRLEPVGHVSLNSLILLFTAGSVLFLFFFSVMPNPRPHETPVDMLLRSVMIAAIYCVSIWCAVMPKNRWPGARRRSGGPRPWLAYFASALVAAGAGAVVSLVVKVLYYAGKDDSAWPRFLQSLPWTLLTFAVAFMVAALADDEPGDLTVARLGHRPLWLVEGCLMVVLMLPVGLYVYRLLQDTTPYYSLVPLTQVLILVPLVSFSIGALVPSWYRQAPPAEATPRLTAAPAPARG